MRTVDGLRDYNKSGTSGEFLPEEIAACENIMDHYASWNPLLREVNEKERHVKHLQTALKRAVGGWSSRAWCWKASSMRMPRKVSTTITSGSARSPSRN